MEIGVPNLLELFKDLLRDPIAYGPISVYIFVLIICFFKGWWKAPLYGLVIIVLYTIGAFIIANHVSIKVLENVSQKETGRASIGVLCFYNVSQSTKNNEDCNNFRYFLARSKR